MSSRSKFISFCGLRLTLDCAQDCTILIWGPVNACPSEKEPHPKIIARMGDAYCSSPAAICYWFAASLIAWGLLSFVGIYWRPFRALSATIIYLAMAAGCAANWFRNRTLHCGIVRGGEERSHYRRFGPEPMSPV